MYSRNNSGPSTDPCGTPSLISLQEDLYLLILLFNPCQHGFITCNYAITRLVKYLECIIPLVYYQFQVDAIYFEFSNAFDPVSHSSLL